MSVVWSRQALDHLEAAFDFVADDNLPAAQRQDQAITRAVQQLVDFPKMGRNGRLMNTRELVIPGTPYVVVYSLTDKNVRVIALLHGARRWPKRF